jgi:polyphenol oxidase
MLVRTNEGVYESTLLRAQSWLRHGFASRHSDSWPGDYTRIKQIHSSIVVVANGGGDPPEHGDAIVTRDPARWVGIRTADCVPLLVADPIHRVVGAIHAGWRGTVAEIASRTVETMASEFDSKPETLIAAIGPCISECCFEVGPEVAHHFERLFPERTEFGHVNLPEANRRQLIAAGLSGTNIDVSNLCTACDSAEFHSYRRDRELSGRMVAAIQIVRT